MARTAKSAVPLLCALLALSSCGPRPTVDSPRPRVFRDVPLLVWGRATLRSDASSPHGSRVAIATSGDGRSSFVRWPGARYGDTELRDGFLRGWIRIDSLRHVRSIQLRLSDTDSFDRFVAFNVPLFADPAFNRVQPGVWTAVTFAPSTAEWVGSSPPSRLTHLGWFVEDNGQGRFVLDVTDFEVVSRPTEGIVSFTFDDGYAGQLAAAEILARSGFAATAYLMPRQIDEPGYLGVQEVGRLVADYKWEIGAHHAIPFTEFSLSDLEREIAYTRDALSTLGPSGSGLHLAYPLGKLDQRTGMLTLVRRDFASARLASGGPETLPPADWHLLRAVNVLPQTSPEELAALLRNARANGEWAILMFHRIVDSPRFDTDYRVADFERLVELVAESGIQVMPVGRVWERYGPPRSSSGD